ncbi:hypothetical protein P3827_24120 [Pseudomonas aeruginosa]|nr:hypothetical protein [Pseudomonas aeruginosa]
MSDTPISDSLIDNIGHLAHTKAKEIIGRTLDLLGIDNSIRGDYLNKIGAQIEKLEFRPSFDLPHIVTTPKQDNTPRNKYADQALLYALYAVYTNDRILKPSRSITNSEYKPYSEGTAKDIFLSLMQANYYMAKLESKEEIKLKPYDGRAEKGAHGKHKKPSKKAIEQLINTMTKSIILQGSLPDNPKGGKLVDAIAERISKTNQDLGIIHYTSPDELKHYIINSIFELESPTKSTNKNLYTLRFKTYKLDPKIDQAISIDSAYAKGKIDTIRLIITQQLEERLGKLSKSTMEIIEKTSELDELLTILAQVHKIKSLQELNLKAPT